MNRRKPDERGSVSLWMCLASVAMVLIVGIAVDLGGQIHAKQRAADIAAQATRAAGNQIEATSAMRGKPVAVDPARARIAAEAYLQAAGVAGTVSVTPADIRVTVHTTYHPMILGTAGIGPQPITGEATARLVRAVNGAEQ